MVSAENDSKGGGDGGGGEGGGGDGGVKVAAMAAEAMVVEETVEERVGEEKVEAARAADMEEAKAVVMVGDIARCRISGKVPGQDIRQGVRARYQARQGKVSHRSRR